MMKCTQLLLVGYLSAFFCFCQATDSWLSDLKQVRDVDSLLSDIVSTASARELEDALVCQKLGDDECVGVPQSKTIPSLTSVVSSFVDEEEIGIIDETLLAQESLASSEVVDHGTHAVHPKSNIFETSSSTSRVKNKKASADNEVYDVVIIGAGWAGVSAALKLHEKGIDNVKVLEAREYVGGRTYTLRDAWNGIDVEMGTGWIFYGNTNPVYDIALKASLNYMSIDQARLQLFMKWGAIKDKKMSELYYAMYAVWAYSMWSKSYLIEEDESMKVSVNETEIDLKDYSKPELKRKVLHAMINTWFGYQSDLENISMWYGLYEERAYLGGYYGYDGSRMINGYSSIIDEHAAPITNKIQLNALVKTIKYKKDIIKVFYDDSSQPFSTDLKVIKARKVIVTIPLSVLKNKGGVKFQPALPKDHRSIIDLIGVGTYTKINMFWKDEDIFWDGASDVLVETESVEGSGFRLTVYNPSSVHGEKQNYLFAELSGSIPLNIEQMYAYQNETKFEEEISNLAMSGLRRMFGEGIASPDFVVVSKWNADPLSKGVYTFNNIGYEPDMRQKLRKPIEDKIFLSGEATSTYHYATAHGAMFTGFMAANKVCQSLLVQNLTSSCD